MKLDSNTQPKLPQKTPQEAHLSDYFDIVIRRKWIVIFMFIIIVGGITAYSLMATPQYEASAKLLLKEQPTPMNPLGENSERLPERNLNYQTQVNMLSNRSLAYKVIQALSLKEKLVQQQEQHFLQKFLNEALTKIESTSTKDAELAQRNEALKMPEVIDWYLKKMEIEPIRDSSLVEISFSGPDPELITIIVNKHAETAIEDTIQQHQKQAKDALDWLKSQIEEQKKEVESSQRAIYEFKKQFNVLSLEDSQIIFSQELQELNSALTRAKSERIAKQATYLQLKEIIKSRQDVLQMPEISNYSVIQNLRNQQINLKSQQIEMGTKYGPKHPKMIELNNGIKQIQSEIGIEIKRLENTIKAELDRATAVESSIVQSLNQQKQIAMDLGERAIDYEVLKQKAESSQDIYDFLLKQAEELGLTSAISSSSMRLVDKAEVPIDTVSPKVVLNILVASFIALFAGTGCAFFFEYLDNTVKTPMDIAVRLGLPVLGMVPVHKELHGKSSNVKMLEGKSDPPEKNFPPLYHISNRLPQQMRSPADGLSGKVLIVESVTMGEGKTTVISQVASNLTDAGLRVLLVDCDFQRPSLDKLFNVSNGGGLGRSIDRILSHDISSGTLNQYSMDDLFFMLSLKKKSGHLIVNNEDQNFVVHFQNGVVLHVQNNSNSANGRIGNMLLKGGFITKDQLEDALERNQRTGQPLGYILVNAGYISREKLRGPLRLQIEEYIQKLFSWKNGHFLFKPGVFNIYENEKIFFDEDYAPMINNLGRVENSKFIDKELFSHIISLEKENLHLLPAGTSYRLIGSLNQILMKKVFEKLRQHFDVVLVDTPPLDAASGIESIFPLGDGLILVIKAGHLSIKMLNGALNHLPQDKIIGAVLNQAKINPQPYYY